MKILKDQRKQEQIDAMGRVFMKSGRVLSGSPINVDVDRSGITWAPSWTDGKTITFNEHLIGQVTSIDDLIRLTGLFVHELAHVLYTPRNGSTVIDTINRRQLRTAFNILEDQRIETFLTSMYPSTMPYLVSTFMRFCIKDESSWETNHILAHGRRYLPADVRDEFRRRFVKQELADTASDIIDEYRKLVFPTDADRAVKLVASFDKILQAIQEGGKQFEDNNGHASGNRPDVEKGHEKQAKDQREAAEISDEVDDMLDEAFEDDEQGEDSEDGPTGSGKGSESDDDSDDDSDEDGEGGSDSDDADGDDKDSNDSGEGSGKSSNTKSDKGGESDSTDTAAGGGSGVGNGMPDEDFRKALQAAKEDWESMPEVVEDVQNKQRTIVSGNDGEITVHADEQYRREIAAPAEDVANVRRFANILNQLRIDSDPGWRKEQDSGRINVRKYMEGAPHDEMWDRWDGGISDACDIECVILIDTSGSMWHCIDEASRAMWTIKRAMESIEASTTVMSFNTQTTLVYNRNEKANKVKYKAIEATGGTRAFRAIEQAVRIFGASKKHNKMLIVITDGEWGYESANGTTSEEMIAALNGYGVTTALAFVGARLSNGHNCSVVANVNNPIELVDFAKGIVTQSIKNRR